jgi:hypothetical protein
MVWALVISFIIGAFCAVRLSILIFTLIVLLVILLFAVSAIGIGYTTATTAIWAILLTAALEAGYVAMHGVFYLLYVRKREFEGKQPPLEVNSKYSAD